nr:SRPBCC domain-containing protein [Thermicanus aegyptius]
MTNASTLTAEITIAAPVNLVWWAWTRSDRITTWFAPKAMIEAKPGGSFELYFDPSNPDSMSTKGCVFTSVEPMRKLGFTWKGPDDFADVMNEDDSLTRVDVTFSEQNGSTYVVVEHKGWGEGELWEKARSWHEMAWTGVLDSLKKALESGEGSICCAPDEEAG